jgi:L-alanine-DL-glutamate epimerase-like enolase superfamily enzyme
MSGAGRRAGRSLLAMVPWCDDHARLITAWGFEKGQKMKIESVDLFYLAMPQILDIGDGSQDALLVRVRAGEWEGWGECEAAPLVSIASWCCPMSHVACKPVMSSVIGQALEGPDDIRRIHALVLANSFDLLQADHTLSGIDAALWDLLGKKLSTPVWSLLGGNRSNAKTPYASALFGADPQSTLEKGREAVSAGYRAVKFGWGPFGRGTVDADIEQLRAAREGLGPDGVLLVDAGAIWDENVSRAAALLPTLRDVRCTWFEEPFASEALHAYSALAAQAPDIKLAGGEGCHNYYLARLMIDHAHIGFVQIDAGRIGGITPARRVAVYARQKNVTYVNHTFTSHLALSASLQPFADHADETLCEYPVELKELARDLVRNPIERDVHGRVRAPEEPGLGVKVNLQTVQKYLVDAEISIAGRVLYTTPRP